jgi:hypothetical protein
MTKKTNENDEIVEFTPVSIADDEIIVTDSQAAESDVKKAVNAIESAEGKPPKYAIDDTKEDADVKIIKALRNIVNKTDDPAGGSKEKSDGSTASYYELPEDATELQHLISFKNMNAQLGEIFRAVYRYGQVDHSAKLRDAKKIKYYIEAEIARLEKYGE